MFFKKKKQVVGDRITLSAIKKIKKLEKEVLNEKSIEKLNNIVRSFLKAKYRVGYSLTAEEVLKRLEEKKMRKELKIDIAHLILNIYNKEYLSRRQITAPEFHELIGLSIVTLNEIATGKRPRKHKEVTIPKKKIKAEKSSKEKPKKQKKSKVFKVIESQLKHLGKTFDSDWTNVETRKIYKKIKEEYAKLSDEEKKSIYPKIMSTFVFK